MAAMVSNKRKADDLESVVPHKKIRMNNETQQPSIREDEPVPEPAQAAEQSMENERTGHDAPAESDKKKGKRRADETDVDQAAGAQPKVKYRKLAPPRPFPTVPTSVSATGPRSAHVEGKNYICITRKTPLAMYLRRCKDVVLKDGHKTLHLNAMGAAIPHMLQLALSLPEILPYAPEEVQTEVLTGTVEVQDEVIPEDDDEDISLRTRGKSTLSVVIKIGDGVDEGPRTGKGRKKQSKGGQGGGGHGRHGSRGGPKPSKVSEQKQQPVAGTSGRETIVVREEDMDED